MSFSFWEECKQSLAWRALLLFTFLPETAVHFLLYFFLKCCIVLSLFYTNYSPSKYQNIVSIERLSMHGNVLHVLPGVLPGSLHGVTLHENPWNCDCKLRNKSNQIINILLKVSAFYCYSTTLSAIQHYEQYARGFPN